MLTPYLYFNGNAAEAVALYADAFREKMPPITRFRDTPADPDHPIPEGWADRVMHAALPVAGGMLMCSDAFGAQVHTDGNITLMATLADEAALRACWSRLAEGGTISMELAPTFFSPLFGTLTDKFGVEWQLGLETN